MQGVVIRPMVVAEVTVKAAILTSFATSYFTK